MRSDRALASRFPELCRGGIGIGPIPEKPLHLKKKTGKHRDTEATEGNALDTPEHTEVRHEG